MLLLPLVFVVASAPCLCNPDFQDWPTFSLACCGQNDFTHCCRNPSPVISAQSTGKHFQFLTSATRRATRTCICTYNHNHNHNHNHDHDNFRHRRSAEKVFLEILSAQQAASSVPINSSLPLLERCCQLVQGLYRVILVVIYSTSTGTVQVYSVCMVRLPVTVPVYTRMRTGTVCTGTYTVIILYLYCTYTGGTYLY